MPAESALWTAGGEVQGSYLHADGLNMVTASAGINLSTKNVGLCNHDLFSQMLGTERDTIARTGLAVFGSAMWFDAPNVDRTFDSTRQRTYRFGSAFTARYGPLRAHLGLYVDFGSMQESYTSMWSNPFDSYEDTSGQLVYRTRIDTLAADAAWAKPVLYWGAALHVPLGSIPVALELSAGMGLGERFRTRFTTDDPDLPRNGFTFISNTSVRVIFFECLALEANTTVEQSGFYWSGGSATYGGRIVVPL